MNEAKKIGFYTAGAPFEGDALERDGGLGGSESAFIQMARALARRGHQVSAFNSCQRPGKHEGVSYHTFADSLPILANKKFDVFIVSRYSAFFNLPFSAGLKVLWNHDTLDNPKELRQVHDEIDLFLVLSNFHKDNFLLRLPQLDDRLVITRNGLDFDLLDNSATAKVDPNKMIYASRPERGLKNLLESIWPRLYKWNPNLRLYICGYQNKLAGMPPHLAALYKHINSLLESVPGLVLLGNLAKPDYYRHLSEASLMLYPAVFPEVSCIAALESQAFGVPVLTSDAFALSETVVTSATKISGRPGSDGYINDYIERAIFLLSNRNILSSLGSQAKDEIRRRHGWDKIAAEWDRLFGLNLKAKYRYCDFVETTADKNIGRQ